MKLDFGNSLCGKRGSLSDLRGEAHGPGATSLPTPGEAAHGPSRPRQRGWDSSGSHHVITASRIFPVEEELSFSTYPHVDCIPSYGSKLPRLPEAFTWGNRHRPCRTLTEVPARDSRLVGRITEFRDECLSSEDRELSSHKGPARCNQAGEGPRGCAAR